MYFYIYGCDVAHFVVLSLVNSILPCVSPCPILRADKRPCGVVETPATRRELCGVRKKAPPKDTEKRTFWKV